MKLRSALRPLLAQLAGVALLAAAPPSAAAGAQVMSWAQLQKLPLPPPGARISYGKLPQQFGELRLPEGKGPFPVFVMIHGGCWQAEYDYVYFTRLAAWLTQRGFATWTIEYRRLGDDGGGWPNTFLDVADGVDALRELARIAPLDLDRVYAAGHSAGGQLALWLPTRARLAGHSPLYRPSPLPIRGVLGLAAITDLQTYRIGPPGSCHASVDPLLGGTPDQVPQRYAETSPRQRLPLGVTQVFIQGQRDPIVAPESVRAYVKAAVMAGDRASMLWLDHGGHFEAAVPVALTEADLARALELLMR